MCLWLYIIIDMTAGQAISACEARGKNVANRAFFNSQKIASLTNTRKLLTVGHSCGTMRM
jgi:hypothetical protein